MQSRWLLGFGFFILGLLAYSTSFQGVMLFDDYSSLITKPLENYLWPDRLLSHSRGLVMWTFAVNHAIHEYDVLGYHIVNFLIHLTNGCLVVAITRHSLIRCGYSETRGEILAWIIGGIFLVHPLQTNAVTYIVQRMESMMALFFLLSCYLLIRFEMTKKPIWGAAVVVCCLLGMRSKEVMIAAPLVLIWYDWAILSQANFSIWKQRRTIHIGLLLTGLLNPAWRKVLPSFYQPETILENKTSSAFVVENLSRWEYFRTQPEVIWKYISLTFWPADLCLDRGWPVQENLFMVLTAGLPLLVLLLLTILFIRKAPVWSFLGGLFFLVLAPTSSIIPIQDLYFEHRMYLPIISIISATVLLAEYAIRQAAQREMFSAKVCQYAGVILAAGVLLGLTTTTLFRNQQYQSTVSMFEDCARKAPWHGRPHLQLANYYEGYGSTLNDHLKAKYHAERAVILDPQKAVYHNILGLAISKLGEPGIGLMHYRAAHLLDPDMGFPLFNMGNYYSTRNLDQAKQYYEKGLEIDPLHPDGNNNYGLILQQEGQYRRAIKHHQQAIDSNPKLWPAYLNLGDAYLQIDAGKAIETYKRVPPEEYDRADVYNNIAMAILKSEQDIPQAFQAWHAGLERFPDQPEAWYHLAEAYFRIDENQKAATILSQGLQKFPNHPLLMQLVENYQKQTPTN